MRLAPTLSGLTLRAEGRAGSGQHQALDGRPAARAGLALAVVDPQGVLVAAGQAFAGAVVGDGRALPGDGLAQDPPQRAEQPLELRSPERARRARRGHPGDEQRFTRIDVPQAAQPVLVEQQVLHGGRPAGEQAGEAREVDAERLGAERGKVIGQILFRQQEHPAEAARVAEAELGAAPPAAAAGRAPRFRLQEAPASLPRLSQLAPAPRAGMLVGREAAMRIGLIPEGLRERALFQSRRFPQPVFDVMGMMLFSRAVMAGVHFGVFDRLADGPRTARELAAEAGCDAHGMTLLLDALVACDYLEPAGDRYRNSRPGEWVPPDPPHTR